jgi:hypothetical protein
MWEMPAVNPRKPVLVEPGPSLLRLLLSSLRVHQTKGVGFGRRLLFWTGEFRFVGKLRRSPPLLNESPN